MENMKINSTNFKSLMDNMRFYFQYYILHKRLTKENNVIMIQFGWLRKIVPLLETFCHKDGSPLTDKERLEINAELMRAIRECK